MRKELTLISTEVEVSWNARNKKRFVELGYEFTAYKEPFIVNVEHLSKGSHASVKIECDYCHSEIIRTYKTYIMLKDQHGTIHKDSCIKCAALKRKEYYMLNYGVESNTHLPEYKQKTLLGIEHCKEAFANRDYTIISNEYVHSSEKLEFICNKHEDKGSQFLSWTQFNRGFGCKYCGYERTSNAKKGENNPNWQGGVTPLHIILRSLIRDWKKESLSKYNYMCALTGLKGELEIHHLYSFSSILKDVLSVVNKDVDGIIKDYTEEELEKIKNVFIEIHNKQELGVPLNPHIHIIFHQEYGLLENTAEQFDEFKERYDNGEFDHLLDVSLKSKDVIRVDRY